MTHTSKFSLSLLIVAVVLLALVSQTQAQATTNGTTPTPTNTKCAPLNTLYKAWVAPCTNNNTDIPETDSDARWRPCICKDGFFPLATATERCSLKESQQQLVTATSLNALCKGVKGYVEASTQQSQPELGPALATVTSIGQAQATDVEGVNTGGIRGDAAKMLGSDSKMMAMFSIAAVVLATAVAF
ncbi:hypothetical protein BCR41DRAFT_384558 [Lobosporangium transversale]|uniref:Extracellular membrane protein CFEM domain-containing protein n=1 Tax=Lobosporangium transversale TaxID=64571 RepID=A0A1Y2GW46_9FUNG|nr:hypothetical protein BCR41DRAFT_384558 [Lobosporangium transversale]ORZ26487.1 hypothetical protein BCR41DRAFT_384558 [Lobosporangium transversale]|eukprot:XP_021884252.1 hypothetical protein BCR41DRAFT_384558 [Lobosporangium transversale]